MDEDNLPPKTKEFGGKTYIRQSMFPSLKWEVDQFRKDFSDRMNIRTVSVGKLGNTPIFYIYARSKARDKK